MQNKDFQLDQMLRMQQQNELSSQEQDMRQDVTSKSQFRKPIRNPFSQRSDESDSDLEPSKAGIVPFPPKPVKTISVLQQAQHEMKWNKEQQVETEILSKLQGNGMKDKKIRELASKYKSLNIAYEKQKTMRKNFEGQLNNMIKTSDQMRKTTQMQDKKQSLDKSLVKNNQKCNNCQEFQKKVMEMRLKNQSLKTQLNKAHRLISREIGQNFDIDQALGEENAWKGRQQKIQKMKSRIKQLEDKLQNNGINVSHMSGFTMMSGTTNAANKTNNFSSTQRTSTLVQNKRKEFDNLKIQVDALKSENDLLQGKVKSLTSRKITLESQIKEMKTEFEKKKQIFFEKSENDDKFISLLKQENQKLKKDEKIVTKVIYKDAKQNNQEVQTLRKQVDSLRKKLKNITKAQDVPMPSQMPRPESKQAIKQQKSAKSINQNPREISIQKKKQIEEEYLKGNKYLKKMSPQDEQQIYRQWKESKSKI